MTALGTAGRDRDSWMVAVVAVVAVLMLVVAGVILVRSRSDDGNISAGGATTGAVVEQGTTLPTDSTLPTGSDGSGVVFGAGARPTGSPGSLPLGANAPRGPGALIGAVPTGGNAVAGANPGVVVLPTTTTRPGDTPVTAGPGPTTAPTLPPTTVGGGTPQIFINFDVSPNVVKTGYAKGNRAPRLFWSVTAMAGYKVQILGPDDKVISTEFSGASVWVCPSNPVGNQCMAAPGDYAYRLRLLDPSGAPAAADVVRNLRVNA